MYQTPALACKSRRRISLFQSKSKGPLQGTDAQPDWLSIAPVKLCSFAPPEGCFVNNPSHTLRDTGAKHCDPRCESRRRIPVKEKLKINPPPIYRAVILPTSFLKVVKRPPKTAKS